MYFPSLAGVGAATALLGWHWVRPVAQNFRSQSCLPESAATQTTCNRFSGSPLEAVTNTRPATTIGPERPRPGKLAFQATFCPVSPSHSSGGWLPSAMLAPRGPRNSAQSAPADAMAINTTHHAPIIRAAWLIAGLLLSIS